MAERREAVDQHVAEMHPRLRTKHVASPTDRLGWYAGREAADRGLQVIVAGAGGAAHLPGMLAAVTPLPVIGVPVALKYLDGMDSLLSIVQMPAGVPVATVAVDVNLAHLDRTFDYQVPEQLAADAVPGARVRVRPGSTVREVNAVLAPYGRKLGPDPASESACTLGGVIADNSSGMHCGTEQNTYRTLESMVMVLPSGTVLDTADHDADRQLREAEPELHEGLLRLRRRVTGDAASTATIERLFAMKNTMGYGLNAFLDETEPVRILQRLMIGSEGTLGFVAEAESEAILRDDEIEDALWLTREEALAAMAGLHPTVKRPRPGAIAHGLLAGWLAGRI